MSDDKGNAADDRVRLVATINDKLAVVQRRSDGALAPAKVVQLGEDLRKYRRVYSPNADGSEYRPLDLPGGSAKGISSGPAQVATDEYRDSWERTFGGRRPPVGQA